MRRFFVDDSQICDNAITITGSDVKHIRDVLRLNASDILDIVSNGKVYRCMIEDISKEKIELLINSVKDGTSESKVHIVLYQGLSKGNKMEFIFQKCTEIGVKEFVPVVTHRSVVKIKDIKSEQNKVDRWNSIVEEAAKQSKRDIIPEVKNVLSFDEMIDVLKYEDNIIIPYEDEIKSSIKDGLSDIKEGRINLIIGPEGGFEEAEISRLKSIGGNVVTLGPRILRTETAGIVSSTIILYEVGNLGVI